MIDTLQLKIAAEKAVQTAHKAVAPLKLFATSFSAAESTQGAAIRVPVFNIGYAAEFNADSNNYAGTTQDVTGVDVNLDKHFVKSVFYTDRDMVECNVDFFSEAGRGIGEQLGRAAVKQVTGLLTNSNVTKNATLTLAQFADKKNIASLYKVADDNDLSPADCVLLLTPAAFANVLANLDADVYGGTDAIRDGMIPGLYGFSGVVMVNTLATGLNGVIVHKEAIGIAGRYLAPDASAYSEVGQMTDEATGLTIGFRRFAVPETGKRFIAGEMLYGAALLQKDKIVLIKNA